jgi:hypothetical protein
MRRELFAGNGNTHHDNMGFRLPENRRREILSEKEKTREKKKLDNLQ